VKAKPPLAGLKLGQAIHRLEDRRLITGSGVYVADVNRPGQVWARIVRSPVAHGRILDIDLDAAREMPGVIGAFSARDAPELASAQIPLRLEAGEDSPIPDWGLQPIIASDRVRFVGEPVAVVVASDPYLAESAAEQVWADIEEEDPVLDALEALDGQVLLHPEVGTNINVDMSFADGVDVDELFASADVVISERFRMHRHNGTPMETRGLVAAVGDDGRLTVWGSAKVKHFNLRAVAEVLGLEPGRVRFLETEVGGGFGARGELYPEDYLVPWLAIRLGRPVKWIEDRAESLIALNHSREQVVELEAAADSDGRLLAFRSRNIASLGAYMRTNGIVPPMLCGQSMHGPYTWSGYESHALGVLTNKTPLGTFRGPGEVEATFARERMLDMIAERVGVSPLELRRRNLLPAEALPHLVTLSDEEDDVLRFGTGNYAEQLDALLEHVQFETLRERYSDDSDPDRLLGIGVACSTSESGVGHSEWARVIAQPDGTFVAYVGIASVGQGIRTALTQVLADQFEVELDRVRVTHHDTDEVTDGEGAFGDRGMIFGTGAMLLAVEQLKQAATTAVAERAGIGPEAVTVVGHDVVWGENRVPLSELNVSGEATYVPGGGTHFSFCAAVAVVAVDRRTGKVTLLYYGGCYDAGRAVNPLMLEGQFTGAAAQGLGGALLEESAYDDSGQPLCGTFMDYIMATAAEMPQIDSLLFEYPETATPLGIKGGGNSGIVCTHAAVANAVCDALREYRVQLTSMPLRADSVRALIRSAVVSG
jgi:aerobic carbon-monoxide dehydrogenase large subunit